MNAADKAGTAEAVGADAAAQVVARVSHPPEPAATDAAAAAVPPSDLGTLTFAWPEMVTALATRTGAGHAVPVMATASLLVHGGLLLALWSPSDAPFGIAGGRASDSVAVELISARALESMARSQIAGSASSRDLVSSEAGNADTTVQDEAAAARTAAKPEALAAPRPEAPLKPEDAPVSELSAALTQGAQNKPAPEIETSKPQQVQVVEPAEPGRDTGSESSQPVTQAAMSAGGATASGSTSVSSEGAAGASAGEVARYLVDVRLAIGRMLGRSRPKHGGQRGTVMVAFALSSGGTVEWAVVSKSSGNPALDQLAFNYIQATRFPAPPGRMSAEQRYYVIPFEFK